MKNLALLALLLLIATPSFAMKAPVQKVQKYKNVEKGIELPTDFAGSIILTPEIKEQIKGKTIHHVELVYTAFRESEDFNQSALNNQRIAQLKRLIPQVRKDNPSWTYVEQEGALTRDEAATYFHGFVLHVGEELDFHELRAFLKFHQNKYSSYRIDNASGGVYVHSSGSKINIPANAVVYEDGTPVVGSYNLQYREFRDQADIAFSGIPMTYEEHGKAYNFSSTGMFELRAVQNGKELKLAQSASVDFNCTRQAEDVDFYAMDDETGSWSKIKPVNFKKAEDVEQDMAVVAEAQPMVAMWIGGKNSMNDAFGWTKTSTDGSNDISYSFNEKSWKLILEGLEESPKHDKMVHRKRLEDSMLWISKKHQNQFDQFVREVLLNWNVPIEINGTPIANDARATMLADGSSDPGHTYPNLVRGLNAPEFGVYNCDQIYRIGKARNINPKYVDSRTGKTIFDKHVACVIDLNYNGAFSFHPKNIICNTEGRNVIVLFTKDKKTYLLPEKKFATLNLESNEQPIFRMVDMTDQLKSPNDLRKYLNL